MGSFYGQVLYEFKKLFSRIAVKNSDSQEAGEKITQAQNTLEPEEEWDQLTYQSGNQWISLASNAQDKTITFSHSKPGNPSDTLVLTGLSVAPQEEIPENVLALQQGQCIKTTVGKYDNAGHIANLENFYYKLPASDESIVLGNIEERVDNIELKHLTIPDNDETPYDSVDNNKGLSIESYLNNNNYVNTDTLNNKMSKYLKENEYVTTAITGVQNTMYPTESRKPAIADTIGDMEKCNQDMTKLGKGSQDIQTISTMLINIIDYIAALSNNINGAQSRITVLVNTLKENEILPEDTNI